MAVFLFVASAWFARAGAYFSGRTESSAAVLHAPNVALQAAEHKRDSENASRSPSNFGDLACMRWTGGSCALLSCIGDRGHTVCEDGYCMCARGTCADAEGKCVDRPGEWLGAHAIRFEHPYEPQRPFIGITRAGYNWFNSSGYNATQHGHVTHLLASSGSSQPAWKIALTAGGHVRFESVEEPGRVMTIYSNRRRRTDDDDDGWSTDGRRRFGSRRRSGSRRRFFLQQLDAHAKYSTNAENEAGVNGSGNRRPKAQPGDIMQAAQNKSVNLHAISDDDDEWPVLIPFLAAHPLDVTFRVRHTAQHGGGLEIWDPKTGYSLASGNPSWFIKDRVAREGIAECRPPGMLGEGCKGRQLVQFEPALPLRATPIAHKDYIYEISILTWWQLLLLCGCACACCAFCATLTQPDILNFS